MKLLSIDEVTEQWHEIAPKIKESLDTGIGESYLSDILVGLVQGTHQCWKSGDAIGISKFNQYKRYKQLQLVTCTGNGWWEYGPTALEVLEEFARRTGCRNVASWGRRGWEKVMKECGYTHAYSVMVKEV